MVRIQGSTVIARSVEDVFDFVADERNEPTYNPRMTRVEMTTPGPVAKGTRWSATVESRERPVDLAMEVTDYVRPSRLGSTTSMSSAEIHGSLSFEPHPAGTTLRWSWQLLPRGPLKLVGPLIAYVGRRQEAAIWASLKRHLEDTPATSGPWPGRRVPRAVRTRSRDLGH